MYSAHQAEVYAAPGSHVVELSVVAKLGQVEAVWKNKNAIKMRKNHTDENARFRRQNSTRTRSGEQASRAKPIHKTWAAALLSTSVAIVGLSNAPTAGANNLSMTNHYLKCLSFDRATPWHINDEQGLDWAGCGAHLYAEARVWKFVTAKGS